MSTQRQLPGTDSGSGRDDQDEDDTPDVVKLAPGSTSYCPDHAHAPDCEKVGADAQTIPYANALDLFWRNELKRADCLPDPEEDDDD